MNEPTPENVAKVLEDAGYSVESLGYVHHHPTADTSQISVWSRAGTSTAVVRLPHKYDGHALDTLHIYTLLMNAFPEFDMAMETWNSDRVMIYISPAYKGKGS